MNEKLIDAAVRQQLDALRSERAQLMPALERDLVVLEHELAQATAALEAARARAPKMRSIRTDEEEEAGQQEVRARAELRDATAAKRDAESRIARIDVVLGAEGRAKDCELELQTIAVEGREREAEIGRSAATIVRLEVELRELNRRISVRGDELVAAAMEGRALDVAPDDAEREAKVRREAIGRLQKSRASLLATLPQIAERARTARAQMLSARAVLADLRWTAITTILQPYAIATIAAARATGAYLEKLELPRIPEPDIASAVQALQANALAWRPTLRDTDEPAAAAADDASVDSVDGEQDRQAA